MKRVNIILLLFTISLAAQAAPGPGRQSTVSIGYAVSQPFVVGSGLNAWADSMLGSRTGNGFQYFGVAIGISLDNRLSLGLVAQGGGNSSRGSDNVALAAGYRLLLRYYHELTLMADWGDYRYSFRGVNPDGYQRLPEEADKDLILRNGMLYYGLELEYTLLWKHWETVSSETGALRIGVALNAGRFYQPRNRRLATSAI